MQLVAVKKKSLIAINPADGKKIREYKTEGMAAARGLMIHETNKNIYFCDQKNLISLKSLDGTPNTEFGKKGKIKSSHVKYNKETCEIDHIENIS